MIQVYRINAEGYYIEPVLVNSKEKIPDDCVENHPPDGLFKPKLVNGQWVNGLSQEKVEEIISAPEEKTTIEILQETVDALVIQSLMGGS